jgi:hypothetical protein
MAVNPDFRDLFSAFNAASVKYLTRSCKSAFPPTASTWSRRSTG